MRSLVALLALLAYAHADESVAAYEQCLNETIGFRRNVERHLISSGRALKQELGEFAKEIMAVFQQDGIKDQCKLPKQLMSPPHPMNGTGPGAGGHPPPPPPPPQPQGAGQPPSDVNPRFQPAANGANSQFVSCIHGIERQFGACFIKEAQIPADVIKALAKDIHDLGNGPHPGGPGGPGFGGPGGPGGPGFGGPGGPGGPGMAFPGFPGGPHPIHAHFANGSMQEIKEKTLEFCGGNQAAADNLLKAGFAVAKKHIAALFHILHPLSLVCEAVGAAQAEKPISDDCQAKLKKAIGAFQTCRKQVPDFFKGNENCTSIHPAAEQANGVANGEHPQFPEHGDFKAVCDNLKEKLATIQSKIGGQQ